LMFQTRVPYEKISLIYNVCLGSALLILIICVKLLIIKVIHIPVTIPTENDNIIRNPGGTA